MAIVMSASGLGWTIIPDYGQDELFLGVGRMSGASVVAISSNWAITARHVGGMTVDIGGTFTAANRYDHPLADFSLLHFNGNPFTTFYEIDYTDQLGSIATLVGFGQTGTATTTGIEITGGAGIRRKANNVLDLVDSVSFGTGSEFDAYIYDLR